ncbi:hypothetical protein BDF21DRAFT_422782 [Thamnidium elegans]|nr:hypothetical protein BDF21DRAFT_422782 [Thamnidium elegans]
MSQSEDGNNSFMAMLNNPVINPGPSDIKAAEEKIRNTRIKPSSIPQVQEVKNKLTSVTKDLYLSSESDEPFEWINTSTNHDSLPTTAKELVQLGLIEEIEELKIQSLQDFFQDNQYEEILKAFKEIETTNGNSKVYLLGEEAITVLILCIIKDKQSSEYAIVGLKSLLVQT